MNDNCIFCKLANGIIATNTLYEDKNFRVILDVGAVTKGHALIISKKHAANLYELPDDTVSQIMLLAKKMALQMTEKLNCDGFNVLQNTGEAAGQTVFHYHMHLIPRYLDDNQCIALPPSNPSVEELEAVRKQITE